MDGYIELYKNNSNQYHQSQKIRYPLYFEINGEDIFYYIYGYYNIEPIYPMKVKYILNPDS